MGCTDTNLKGVVMGRMDGNAEAVGSVMAAQSLEAFHAENQGLRGRIAQLETELAVRQREVDRLRHQASYRESSRSDSVEQEIKAWRGEVDELVSAIRIIARRLK